MSYMYFQVFHVRGLSDRYADYNHYLDRFGAATKTQCSIIHSRTMADLRDLDLEAPLFELSGEALSLLSNDDIRSRLQAACGVALGPVTSRDALDAAVTTARTILSQQNKRSRLDGMFCSGQSTDEWGRIPSKLARSDLAQRHVGRLSQQQEQPPPPPPDRDVDTTPTVETAAFFASLPSLGADELLHEQDFVAACVGSGIGVSEAEGRRLFSQVDTAHRGVIDKAQFRRAVAHSVFLRTVVSNYTRPLSFQILSDFDASKPTHALCVPPGFPPRPPSAQLFRRNAATAPRAHNQSILWYAAAAWRDTGAVLLCVLQISAPPVPVDGDQTIRPGAARSLGTAPSRGRNGHILLCVAGHSSRARLQVRPLPHVASHVAALHSSAG